MELASLTNDIGSVERDAPQPNSRQELNLVWLDAPKHGGIDHAIRHAIEHYNVSRAAFASTAQELIHRAIAESAPYLAEYATVLTRMVDGNLTATRHLVRQRYPGASQHLEALHTAGATSREFL